MIKHPFFLLTNSRLPCVAHAGTVLSPAELWFGDFRDDLSTWRRQTAAATGNAFPGDALCCGQLVTGLLLSLLSWGSALQPPALPSRALLPTGTSGSCAALASTGHHPTPSARDTSSPNSPALSEAGFGPRGPKKANRESKQVVVLVGWFLLAASSVLAAEFCCGGETASPSPWATPCQQEVLTHEMKCSICIKRLHKKKCFPREHSLCLGLGSNISIFTFLLSKTNNQFLTRIKQAYNYMNIDSPSLTCQKSLL